MRKFDTDNETKSHDIDSIVCACFPICPQLSHLVIPFQFYNFDFKLRYHFRSPLISAIWQTENLKVDCEPLEAPWPREEPIVLFEVGLKEAICRNLHFLAVMFASFFLITNYNKSNTDFQALSHREFTPPFRHKRNFFFT